MLAKAPITSERIMSAIMDLARINEQDPHDCHRVLLERLEAEWGQAREIEQQAAEDPFKKYLKK